MCAAIGDGDLDAAAGKVDAPQKRTAKVGGEVELVY